jgi:hypothetical protein
LRLGQRLAAHLARRGFGRFSLPDGVVEVSPLSLDPAFGSLVPFLIAALHAGLARKLVAPRNQLLGRQRAQLISLRLVVRRPLPAVSFRCFGDVRDRPAQVRVAGGDLLASGLDVKPSAPLHGDADE